MWEWASSRPQRCLKFGADSIAWAETERNWRGQRRHKCVMSPLSEGMIKPSPTEENVPDLSALANRIRALTNPDSVHQAVGGAMLSDLPQRIAVLLPDTAAAPRQVRGTRGADPLAAWSRTAVPAEWGEGVVPSLSRSIARERISPYCIDGGGPGIGAEAI